MDVILMYAAVISVITMATVEAVKQSTSIPKEYMTAISIGIGIAIGVIALFIPEITGDISVGGHILAGAISGLAASGLFDLGKNTKQAVQKNIETK